MKTATIDIETNGFIATVVWCACILDHNTLNVSTYQDISSFLKELDEYDTIYGHNIIAFDLPVLKRLYNYDYHGTIVDTLLVSRLQQPNRNSISNPNNPHSVAAWANRLGKIKIENDIWNKFSPIILERCKEDVRIQYEISLALASEDKENKFLLARRLTNRLFCYLQKQEQSGWKVDKEHIHQCICTLQRWMQKIDKAVQPKLPLIREILETRNGRFLGFLREGQDKTTYNFVRKPFRQDGQASKQSSDYCKISNIDITCISGPFSRILFRHTSLDKASELKDFLLSLGWQPTEWNTDDEGKRTSPKLSKNDKWEGIEGKLGKLIVRRVQCKQRIGILEGWLEKIREDGRISPIVTGLAVTGRAKHSVIVNVPSPQAGAFFGAQMRRVFITSTSDRVMIGVDSKGNQLRQLAARMQDDEFTNSVLFGTSADGTDTHSINQRRAGLPNRTEAKNFFYGLLFGAGDAKIAKVIRRTTREAKELKRHYFEQMPGLRNLLNKLSKEWRKTAKTRIGKYGIEYYDGFISGLDGRPIQVPHEHELLVYQLQSDEAIQMSAAYVWMCSQMEKRGYRWGDDWQMLIWYHDEYQLECKIRIKDEIKALAEESIAWAGRFYKIVCPHQGESKEGRNWYETH